MIHLFWKTVLSYISFELALLYCDGISEVWLQTKIMQEP